MSNSPSNIKSFDYLPETILNERFVVKRKIATGGMGNIYLCQDLVENIQVAVKILHRSFQNDREYLERFSREVWIASKINHPNVVKVFDLYQSPEHVFFSMEYIYGESVEDRAIRQPYTEQQITRLLIEVADGLSAIHQQDLIHRDLKPGNIMCQPDGSHKIIDFGVSKSPLSRLTKKNVRVGSFAYIAPEIWLGKKVDCRSDFYSFGCLLYELINGQPPFVSDSPMEQMKKHCNEAIPDFINPVSLWMEELVRELLAKNPEERPSGDQIISRVRGNNLESQSVQIFDSHFDSQTVRSGQSMITVLDNWEPIKGVRPKKEVKTAAQKRRQLVFSLQATNASQSESAFNKIAHQKRGKTVVLKLPMNSALIFNFELPTRDFLFLGVFLGSLNLFDWYLTHQGVSTMGIAAEGNNFLKNLMHKYGTEEALFYAKGSTIFLVLMLTVMARKCKLVKDLVGFLSIVYLVAAIIPWIYILYYR